MLTCLGTIKARLIRLWPILIKAWIKDFEKPGVDLAISR